MSDQTETLKTQATEDFAGWAQKYISYLSRLAAFLRDLVDSDPSSLPVSASLTGDTQDKLERFNEEVLRLYSDYIFIRQKYRALLPNELVDARDLAFATLRRKMVLAVTGVRLAVSEFLNHPAFAALPADLKAQLEPLATWNVDLQMEEFREVFAYEIPRKPRRF